jgi:hypothetical protein
MANRQTPTRNDLMAMRARYFSSIYKDVGEILKDPNYTDYFPQTPADITRRFNITPAFYNFLSRRYSQTDLYNILRVLEAFNFRYNLSPTDLRAIVGTSLPSGFATIMDQKTWRLENQEQQQKQERDPRLQRQLRLIEQLKQQGLSFVPQQESLIPDLEMIPLPHSNPTGAAPPARGAGNLKAKYMLKVSNKKNKKYDIFKLNPKTHDYDYLLSFGDSRYQHFKDSTPLKHWSNLDHSDKERRRLYLLRSKKTDNKNSAHYWARKYLW